MNIIQHKNEKIYNLSYFIYKCAFIRVIIVPDVTVPY